ncbi:cytochrome c oxidase subunit II [Pendulispora brunnea]|uniref:cytochrome-c oxidase n=1 Tax=Pendulispora brunnea TaxID=2905690 RepID=A0ABZ2KNP1_9BACT
MPYASHSALEPAGLQAVHIERLWWVYFGISSVIFVLVLGALALALRRRRREMSAQDVQRKRHAVTFFTTATVVTLLVLLVMSILTGRAIASLSLDGAVTVEVSAHRWWWEFRYPVDQGATRFSTAYEMHIPVGRPIRIKLEAHDVIHSFWVPNLHGKRDMIPGKTSTLVLRADRPGAYEGQCAEFCGTQHANMRFLIIAESESDFRAWQERQLAPSVPPDEPQKQRGQTIFLQGTCATCHTIRGTHAFATVGPELTHVASRRRLAMGTLDNDIGHLGGWISDPQAIKPGVLMPATPLAPDDFQALLAYLRSLQ